MKNSNWKSGFLCKFSACVCTWEFSHGKFVSSVIGGKEADNAAFRRVCWSKFMKVCERKLMMDMTRNGGGGGGGVGDVVGRRFEVFTWK